MAKFTDTDIEAMKHTAKVLGQVEREIRIAIQGEERMPEAAYNALSRLSQMRLELENWATLLETKRWQLLLNRKLT